MAAAEIAKNREQVVFPQSLDDDTFRSILRLDQTPQHSKDVDGFFQRQNTGLTGQLSQTLDELPYFTMIKAGAALTEGEEMAIRQDLFEFVGGNNAGMQRGGMPGLQVTNPDLLYLPTSNSNHHRGTLINLSSKEIVAIPNGSADRVRLFSTDEFRQFINPSPKDRDSIKDAFEKNENLNDLRKYSEGLNKRYYLLNSNIFAGEALQKLKDKSAGEIQNSVATYMNSVAAGIVDPSDQDAEYIRNIINVLDQNGGSYDSFADVPSKSVSTLDDLKRTKDNPVLGDWQDRLKDDWDYEVKSDSEQWWLDAAQQWGPSLRWAGYALSAGLSLVPGVGITGSVLIGVAMNAVTDLSVDAATLVNTDDARQREQLMDEMFTKFSASLTADVALGGLGKGASAAMSLFQPTMAKVLSIAAAKSGKSVGDAAASLTSFAAKHAAAPALPGLSQKIRQAITQFGQNYAWMATQGELGTLLSTCAATELGENAQSFWGQVATQVLAGALTGGVRGAAQEAGQARRTYQQLKAQAKQRPAAGPVGRHCSKGRGGDRSACCRPGDANASPTGPGRVRRRERLHERK
ncbi:hypothetical protein [Ensifer sp. SL37]|uniref:hypothetical protein n=1 Tax=Ensifer sp. SL37 TaxID=2995137 RepID=UPI0022763D02|nr:hypothetical protein [Ensifer sp. SL37]MCY1740560.1 hypothetical protein [Ensifer sp. SL37]